MPTLLQVNSSLYSGDGQSTQLADRLAVRWRASHPGGRVIVRDLARDPVPHLDAATFTAFRTPPGELTPEQARAVAYSDALVAELRAADTIVLALPLYNFGVPSTLKAWFDHVARAGVRFRYTPQGPVGLLPGKTVYVAAARGGRYAGTGNDHQTPFIRQLLGFLGMDDVRFVYAEGLALDATSREQALARAAAEIDRLAGPVRSAA
jgi:FMN-dependent NADH-azoreductase